MAGQPIDFLPFRRITKADNEAVADTIRTVMTAEGLSGEGYSIHDPEVDAMAEAYARPGAAFYVLENNDGDIVGVGGIAPLAGGPEGVCELQKMYFREEVRGQGMGIHLLSNLLALAKKFGYRAMYLESKGHLVAAVKLYEKFGFRHLDAPMGATGHGVCDVLMVLEW